MDTVERILQLENQYRDQAARAESPLQFYLQLHKDGISMFTSFVLMRDLLQIGLRECQKVHSLAMDHWAKESRSKEGDHESHE